MTVEYTFDATPGGIFGTIKMKIPFKDATVTAHVGLTSTHFDIDCRNLHLQGLTGEQLVEMAYPEIDAKAKALDAPSESASNDSPVGSGG